MIVDLPPEEAESYVKVLAAHDLETTFLTSPTTSDFRLKLVDKFSTGFVYYVSRMGVTGAQKAISETLAAEVEHIKKFIKSPLAIGFGISTPAQAKTVSLYSDAIVVGSALVDLIEKNPNPEEAQKAITKLATEIVSSL